MTPIFETKRLVVRPWSPEETDALQTIYGHPEMYRYMPGAPPATPEDLAAMAARIQGRYARWPGMGTFAAVSRDTGKPIGSALIRPLVDGPEIEVGYHIARDEWRKGYATEIARGLVRYAFERFGLDAVYGVVVPENTGSRKALRNAGLREIGAGEYYGLQAVLLRITRAEEDALAAAAALPR